MVLIVLPAWGKVLAFDSVFFIHQEFFGWKCHLINNKKMAWGIVKKYGLAIQTWWQFDRKKPDFLGLCKCIIYVVQNKTALLVITLPPRYGACTGINDLTVLTMPAGISLWYCRCYRVSRLSNRVIVWSDLSGSLVLDCWAVSGQACCFDVRPDHSFSLTGDLCIEGGSCVCADWINWAIVSLRSCPGPIPWWIRDLSGYESIEVLWTRYPEVFAGML